MREDATASPAPFGLPFCPVTAGLAKSLGRAFYANEGASTLSVGLTEQANTRTQSRAEQSRANRAQQTGQAWPEKGMQGGQGVGTTLKPSLWCMCWLGAEGARVGHCAWRVSGAGGGVPFSRSGLQVAWRRPVRPSGSTLRQKRPERHRPRPSKQQASLCRHSALHCQAAERTEEHLSLCGHLLSARRLGLLTSGLSLCSAAPVLVAWLSDPLIPLHGHCMLFVSPPARCGFSFSRRPSHLVVCFATSLVAL
jgi:hypothetical protein